jgi:SsrA-binding protein
MDIINRKVKFEYEVIETFTAGMKLFGSEIKSIRAGKVSMVDTFCFFKENELFVKGMNISNDGVVFAPNATRDRKLLLNKKELKSLNNDLVDGLSIVPYRIFLNENGFAKLEIILGKGKKLYDKRQSIKKKDIERDLKRENF